MTPDQLTDIEQIKQLKARYFRHMDMKEWDNWGQVFALNCRMEVPEADMAVDGRQNIVDAVSAALTGARTCHHGHMPEITLTGADSATGIWAMFDYVEWEQPEGKARVGLNGYGHYLEEYVREDGAWRIAKLHLRRLRVDAL